MREYVPDLDGCLVAVVTARYQVTVDKFDREKADELIAILEQSSGMHVSVGTNRWFLYAYFDDEAEAQAAALVVKHLTPCEVEIREGNYGVTSLQIITDTEYEIATVLEVQQASAQCGLDFWLKREEYFLVCYPDMTSGVDGTGTSWHFDVSPYGCADAINLLRKKFPEKFPVDRYPYWTLREALELGASVIHVALDIRAWWDEEEAGDGLPAYHATWAHSKLAVSCLTLDQLEECVPAAMNRGWTTYNESMYPQDFLLD